MFWVLDLFPKQCLHCRGSGGDSGTDRFLDELVSRLRRSTFIRRRGTWWVLPRSRAGEKLGRATFRRKTLHCIFSIHFSPQPRKWPWWLQGDPWWLPRAPGGPSRAVWRWSQRPLWDPASRIPPPGFLLWDSSPRNPPSRFRFQDSSPRIPR